MYALKGFYFAEIRLFYYIYLCYNIKVTVPKLVREGGVSLAPLISFFVAVAAGVAVHYICKWLDGND